MDDFTLVGEAANGDGADRRWWRSSARRCAFWTWKCPEKSSVECARMTQEMEPVEDCSTAHIAMPVHRAMLSRNVPRSITAMKPFKAWSG